MRSIAPILGLSVLLGFSGSALAITARPQAQAALGAGAAAYFSLRPDIVDLAESPASTRPAGTTRALVILIDFVDRPAERETHTPEFFRRKLFGMELPSLRSYFRETSYGRFTLDGDVVGWLRSDCRHGDIVNRDGVPGTRDDYGLDISGDAVQPSLCEFPLNIWGLTKHAVETAAEQVNLQDYDGDGDGTIDALFIVHSGIGAETRGGSPGSEDYIWSLESSLDYYAPTRGTSIDGVRVGPFVVVPELGEIGVYAHEFCHLMGLPDLYNSLTGKSVVGPLCLMDGGAWLGPQGREGSVPCHLSTLMKYKLGWLDPERVCLGCAGGVPSLDNAEVRPLGVGVEPSAYSVLNNPGGMDWTPDGRGSGEYFIIENREPGYGYFEAYSPGSGLLIWRIDESRRDNNTVGRRLAEVIQADGETFDPDKPTTLPGEPSDFWPGTLAKRELNPYSVPPSTLSGGRFSGVAIENIQEQNFGLITADITLGVPRRGRAYAYPNPYSLDSLRAGPPIRIVFVPEIGPAKPLGFEVTIFDLDGNAIRRLSRSAQGETDRDSTGTALWDGRDEGGGLVEPGVYFYAVRSSGEQATGAMAIKK